VLEREEWEELVQGLCELGVVDLSLLPLYQEYQGSLAILTTLRRLRCIGGVDIGESKRVMVGEGRKMKVMRKVIVGVRWGRGMICRVVVWGVGR
jgi:hypothetical protein